METHILDQVPFHADMETLQRQLHLRGDASLVSEFASLYESVRPVGRPKAAYALAGVDEVGDDYVIIEGERFDSRILAVNLVDSRRVFMCIATCGREFDAWYAAKGSDDFLHGFWLDAIKEAALRNALRAMRDDLTERYRPGKIASMAPGSLANWPISQQRPLFRLMADAADAIGLRLTDSCLMDPNKSVSGIRFGTEETFESCMLCPRVGCPSRRAPYDPALYQERYGMGRALPGFSAS